MNAPDDQPWMDPRRLRFRQMPATSTPVAKFPDTLTPAPPLLTPSEACRMLSLPVPEGSDPLAVVTEFGRPRGLVGVRVGNADGRPRLGFKLADIAEFNALPAKLEMDWMLANMSKPTTLTKSPRRKSARRRKG